MKFLAIATALGLAACSQQPADNNILATVGDETLTVAEFQSAMKSRGVAPGAEQLLLDELIAHMKLVHAAKQRGYHEDPKVVRSFENALVARLRQDLESESPATPEISEADLQEYYNTHLAEFTTPARIRAAHIFVAAAPGLTPEKRAEKLAKITTARNTAPDTETHFSAHAVKFSEHQSTRYQGGDLGYLIEGTNSSGLPENVESALFAMQKPGTLSDIIETPDGFYLLKLIDKNPSTSKPFAKVRPVIQSRLHRQRQTTAKESLATTLTAGIPATINTTLFSSTKASGSPAVAETPPSLPR